MSILKPFLGRVVPCSGFLGISAPDKIGGSSAVNFQAKVVNEGRRIDGGLFRSAYRGHKDGTNRSHVLKKILYR